MVGVNRVRGALLILAVLAGVFAMHALAPGVVISPAHHTEAAAPAHDAGGAAHLDHADPDCVAGGVGGAPSPVGAGAGVTSGVTVPPVVAAREFAGPGPPWGHPRPEAGGGAPPSLSSLQSLRI
ncbi:hypothetical protein SXIM_40860 [Streptomyces xiamenensis]|uniref:Uncharacterized protein n=1 Tax=Streptomyces xiamenensis TaxID=408015 RepID=A0A0F7FXN9_9ACTN|nr:hypothetical protein SXIM_40860 [Streptomyces xiamenensis]